MSRDEASLLDIFADEMRLSAILYQIQIVGEATKHLSVEFREQYPGIPWSRAAGMRDIIAHQYERIDIDVVWTVIQQSIPELLEMLAPLLPEPELE